MATTTTTMMMMTATIHHPIMSTLVANSLFFPFFFYFFISFHTTIKAKVYSVKTKWNPVRANKTFPTQANLVKLG